MSFSQLLVNKKNIFYPTNNKKKRCLIFVGHHKVLAPKIPK